MSDDDNPTPEELAWWDALPSDEKCLLHSAYETAASIAALAGFDFDGAAAHGKAAAAYIAAGALAKAAASAGFPVAP